MIEYPVALEWTRDTLLADPEVAAAVGERVYSDVAPAGCERPYILISDGGNHDTLGVGAVRIFTHEVLVVRAVAESPSFWPLKALANRIDAALHGGSGITAEGRVLACTREGTHRLTTVEGGRQFRELGGKFRLLVQPL